jgi:predicted nicotinamide N-methyase
VRRGGATPQQRAPVDAQAFVRENTHILPVPGLPDIRMHTAHPGSGLWRLAGPEGDEPHSPYWAYPWAGGAALATHLRNFPELAAGRSVLDLGTGSGLAAIAAAKAGARMVTAADIDPHAVAAVRLNAAVNRVAVTAVLGDLTAGPPPAVDLVTVGDLFYEADLAGRVTAFLDRCIEAGIAVLVGDPWRANLPRARLRLLADYTVTDFGMVDVPAAVFAFEPR